MEGGHAAIAQWANTEGKKSILAMVRQSTHLPQRLKSMFFGKKIQGINKKYVS